MSESTGKGHQVPDSTSLSIRLATEYNEPTVPGTTEIVPSTKELTETTTAPGGLVQHTMASQEDGTYAPIVSPGMSTHTHIHTSLILIPYRSTTD